MINVVSRSLASVRTTGPQKVAVNLLKGLDRIGYPYVVNRDISSTGRLWIHDDTAALRYAHLSHAKVVVGPNLYVMPDDVPPSVRLRGMRYVLPGPTSAGYWERLGFARCDLSWWPVGIDTDECAPSLRPAADRCVMLYHKQRDAVELALIQRTLVDMGVDYRLVVYGEYEQADYLSTLASTSFIVWHGRNESQGIALQEALSCGVPVLVCDITTLDEERSGHDYGPIVGRFPGTAAPFFDERCGWRITDLRELPTAVARMQDGLADLHPREYVLENLGLEKQAHEFVALWETWGLDEESGRLETARNDRPLSEPWRHKMASAPRRVFARVGRAAKSVTGRH
jgi:glycosyltransferase involved in cell wall biosynthesis